MSVCKLEIQAHQDSKDFGSVFCATWKKRRQLPIRVHPALSPNGTSTSEGGRLIQPSAWQQLTKCTSEYKSSFWPKYWPTIHILGSFSSFSFKISKKL